MVSAVRRGASLRKVARRFNVSLLTVQRWVERSNGQRLDRIDWSDRPSKAHTIHRTAAAIEDTVLMLRQELSETSDLGEYGAAAIHREMLARHDRSVPAVRTIGRILERRGVLDSRRRVRRPPPPRGWYLPEVAKGRAELDSFDVVEGLVIKGGTEVEVLNGISLHGGLVASWPGPPVRARTVVEALVTHWRQFGLPAYAQFDNDTRFQGAHQFPDTVGRVTRLCLSLGIVPVFAPPRETGFQAAVESYNGRWQAKVWARFHHATRAALRERSDRYVAAARQRAVPRLEAAPPRRPFPKEWELDLQASPRGRLVFLRRLSEQGTAHLLGHTWTVDLHQPHRLVRAEVDFDAHRIRFYALQRRKPRSQPLLTTVRYRFPRHGFQE